MRCCIPAANAAAFVAFVSLVPAPNTAANASSADIQLAFKNSSRQVVKYFAQRRVTASVTP